MNKPIELKDCNDFCARLIMNDDDTERMTICQHIVSLLKFIDGEWKVVKRDEND